MRCILKNSEVKERICFLSSEPFINEDGTLFTDEHDRAVCPEVALTKSIEIDPKFMLPSKVTSCEKLGIYLDQLGVKHTSQTFREMYKKFSANLPLRDAPKVH